MYAADILLNCGTRSSTMAKLYIGQSVKRANPDGQRGTIHQECRG